MTAAGSENDHFIYAELTATKQVILSASITPAILSPQTWLSYFQDHVCIERSVAVINNARTNTVDPWDVLCKTVSDINNS